MERVNNLLKALIIKQKRRLNVDVQILDHRADSSKKSLEKFPDFIANT